MQRLPSLSFSQPWLWVLATHSTQSKRQFLSRSSWSDTQWRRWAFQTLWPFIYQMPDDGAYSWDIRVNLLPRLQQAASVTSCSKLPWRRWKPAWQRSLITQSCGLYRCRFHSHSQWQGSVRRGLLQFAWCCSWRKPWGAWLCKPPYGGILVPEGGTRGIEGAWRKRDRPHCIRCTAGNRECRMRGVSVNFAPVLRGAINNVSHKDKAVVAKELSEVFPM